MDEDRDDANDAEGTFRLRRGRTRLGTAQACTKIQINCPAPDSPMFGLESDWEARTVLRPHVPTLASREGPKKHRGDLRPPGTEVTARFWLQPKPC